MQSFLMQAPAGDQDTMRWIAIAIGVLGLAYILLRPKFGRRKDPLENVAPRFTLAQQRSLERDMNNLVVELSEMARQITAQLDTRSTKLEALIEEADQRIEELKRLSSAQAPASPFASSPPGPSPADPPAGASPEPAAADPAPTAPDAIDPRHADVYALADEGLGPQDIAHRLNRPSGEVELILALRPTSADR